MARKNDGLAFEPAENDMIHDVLSRVSVDSTKWIVQDVYVRILVHRAREADALLLPAGEINSPDQNPMDTRMQASQLSNTCKDVCDGSKL